MLLEKNLKYLRKRDGISQEKLATALGVKRSTYRDYENGTTEPSISFLIVLADHFNISIDQLLRKDLAALDLESLRNKDRSTLKNSDFRVLSISVNEKGDENIEYVSNKARAGYLAGFANPEYLRDLRRFSLPGISRGTYRAFEISGDSMPPVHEGSIVIGRYVEHWRNIVNHRTYILITDEDGLVYKRVINRVKEKGCLVLLSDNPLYEPYTVPIDEVKEVWSYYAHLSFTDDQSHAQMDAVLQRLDHLGNEVNGLSSLIRNKMR